MARKNTPSSLERWAEVQTSAPYRASINADCYWESGRPAPDIAQAMKVIQGGQRMMVAFHLAELRDYFVEGHLDQGAQVEPDGAEKPSPRQRKSTKKVRALTLQQSFANYRYARQQRDYIDQGLKRIFCDDAIRLVLHGKTAEAIDTIDAMPDCPAKGWAISELANNYKLNIGTERATHGTSFQYNKDQARMLLLWQRAKNAYDSAIKTMEEILAPLVQDCIAHNDRHSLNELIAITPHSVVRAFMIDALNYRMQPTNPSKFYAAFKGELVEIVENLQRDGMKMGSCGFIVLYESEDHARRFSFFTQPSDDELVVVEIDSTGLDITRSPSNGTMVDVRGDAWFCNQSIPPESIVFPEASHGFKR
jgi:hypothetical protein